MERNLNHKDLLVIFNSKTEKELLENFYRRHKSIQKVADKLNFSRASLHNRLQYHNIHYSHFKTFVEEKLFFLPLQFIKTTSQLKLSRMVGCSRSQICRILKKYNIDGIKMPSGRPKNI